MPTEMIILGLIFEKPLTGYEIKKMCDEKYMHFTQINTSTIYSTLKRLEKEEMIKGKTVQGERMEKRIFSMTDSGANLFLELLQKNISLADFLETGKFNAALSFAKHIDKKQLKALLEKRKDAFTGHLERMSLVKCRRDWWNEKILMDRGVSHMKAEIYWIKQAIEELK